MASYPMNLAPMTELDGVNCLLLSIGNAPVNALDTPGNKDAAIARLTLFDVSRQTQAKGWWFNREYGYPLVADANGNIAVPATTLQLAGADTKYRVIQRNGQLYDLDARSFVFPVGTTVLVDLTQMFAFETLPQVARNYITARAARIFQTNTIGSDILYRFGAEQVAEAYTSLIQADTRAKRANVLQGPRMTQVVSRYGRSAFGRGNIFNR